VFREELEKQQAKEHYEKLHLAGKTDEARADLARLALIKKQREDAAKKREEERKGVCSVWVGSTLIGGCLFDISFVILFPGPCFFPIILRSLSSPESVHILYQLII